MVQELNLQNAVQGEREMITNKSTIDIQWRRICTKNRSQSMIVECV